MILPENGKIVIVDDDEIEAKPLMDILYQNNLPFLYYNDVSQLPKKPIDNIRVLFLDLKLVMTTNPRQVVGSVSNWIKRLLNYNSGPYVLITWSKHNEDYLDDLIIEFANGLKKYRPITVLSLSKNSYLKTIAGGKKVPKRGALRRIERKIESELNANNVLKLLLFWEILLQKSCATTINQISALCPNIDKVWNNNMNSVFIKLAKAQAGEHLNDCSRQELIKYSFETLNCTFLDTLENTIEKMKIPSTFSIVDNNILYSEVSNGHEYSIKKRINRNQINYELYRNNVRLSSGGNLTESILNNVTNKNFRKKFKKILFSYHLIPSKINKTILISNKTPNSIFPGNVYEIHNLSKVTKKEILKNYYKEDIIVDDFISDILLIEIETSPACDYAQKKMHKSRLVSGILAPDNKIEKSKLSKNAFYIYFSPSIERNNKKYKFLLDFRRLKSEKMDMHFIDNRKFLFRVKHELYVDLLTSIATHVNRGGVTYVE
jgi:hypothetical protein